MKREGGVKAESREAATPRAYRDIPLYSIGARTSVTHLMKFASHQRVDPNQEEQFTPPVKLNRKMPLRLKMPPAQPGDPVIDRWGKPVMTKEGPPLRWPAPDADLEAIQPYLGLDQQACVSATDHRLENEEAAASGVGISRSRPFRKRVREVHKSANAARRTRNEEFFPWVLEDFETSQEWESSREPLPNSLKALEQYYYAEKERREHGLPPPKTEPGAASQTLVAPHAPWIGQLEGDSDENSTSHHVLFAFDERNAGGFQVVPVRRQYKFMQLHKHAMTSDQIEEEFSKQQRSAESDRWMMRTRYNTGAGLGGPDGLRGVRRAGGRGLPSLALPGAPSLGWQSSAQLVAVRGERERMRDDDDDLFGSMPKQETTCDELDFEEEFADDEEKPIVGDDAEDPEARELEDRLKREMVADRVDDDVRIKREPDEYDDAVAVNRRSGGDALFGDASYGRHDDAMLTGSGRQMRKIMKALSQREGLDMYDSDEEAKNPYASDESDDEDLDVLHPERAILAAREEKARQERLAKEANGVSSATSPEPDGGVKRKNDMPPRSDDGLKRARTDSRASSPSAGMAGRSGSPPRPLTPLELELVQLISDGRITNTTDLVQHFRARLKQGGAALKEELSAAVKRIAYMDKKENRLKLKDAVAEGAASPARSP